MPVTLHLSCLRERGYNQAKLVARAISKASGIPVFENMARKKHATLPQSKLGVRKRLVSLKQAFSANKWPNIDRLAIIDDVPTSGATLNELAKILKNVVDKRVDC